MSPLLAGGPPEARFVRIRRRLDASPERVYRAWADPDELTGWFPDRVEGSLVPGSRSTLVWAEQRVWWEVVLAEPNSRFRFRWPWLDNERLITLVSIEIRQWGYGSELILEDGPFDVTVAEALDAYAEALEGWGDALTRLRAQLDFSVDLRPT